MATENILDYFASRGLKALLLGNRFLVLPRTKITDEDRAFSNANRTEIIAALQERAEAGQKESGKTRGSSATGRIAELIRLTFDRLIEEASTEIVEALDVEYEERVAIMIESANFSEETAELLASREHVKLWLGKS